jgi:hypothetical protein
LNEVGIENTPLGEPFRDSRPLIWASKLVPALQRRLIIMTIYLIAAAVVICGCLFFFMRARSRD